MNSWQTVIVAGMCALVVSAGVRAQQQIAAEGPYTYAAPSRDGIGKYYFSREIARVMGHRGAAWLERKTRTVEERSDLVVRGMELAPDANVADIGAGTGYFSFLIAQSVPAGRVYAVDIQPEMLEIVRKRIKRRSISNVVPVLGKLDNPMLPDQTIDAVLLVDAYHEFEYPLEMVRGIVRALRPQGRVFLIEYRGEDPRIPIKPLHKMTQRQAVLEFEAAGLRWVETEDFLPKQHFMVFEKPAGL